jgi:hypothetical protein
MRMYQHVQLSHYCMLLSTCTVSAVTTLAVSSHLIAIFVKCNLASSPAQICALALSGCCGVGVLPLQFLTLMAASEANYGAAMSAVLALPHLIALRIGECIGMPVKKGLLGIGKVPWSLRILVNNRVIGTSGASTSPQVMAERPLD